MTVGRSRARAFKVLTITVPSVAFTIILLAIATEVWVRLVWDDRKGTPGLFVSHPTRGQTLSPNYDGWFAGVPVRINNLGFRDDRDYALEKGHKTFRILVLGDSVTFGHGAITENTYPKLLERLLHEWRPDIDWQVLNAAVPGYNTSQELAQLLELGPSVQPDLVVVGFYENDLVDNRPIEPASRRARWYSRVLAFVQRHVYSFELYKKVLLTAAWRFSGSDDYRLRVEHLGTEAELLSNMALVKDQPEQQLTPYERMPPEQPPFTCDQGETPGPMLLPSIQSQPGWEHWLRAVRELQSLHRNGTYRVTFFLNIVPPVCPNRDWFYEGNSRVVNDFLMNIVADGTPAVSALDAFLRRRPSQMPYARAHAIGNTNMTKAEVLFDYLRREVLPPLVDDAVSAKTDRR
jgi:GDSL-like Lipase/Acylhydrolase family